MGASKSLIVLMGLLLTSCSPEGGDEDTDTGVGPPSAEFVCEIGLSDADGAYVSAVDNDPVELILGFQGFLFLEFMVRAEAGSPSPVLVRMSMEVDGEDPFDGSQPQVALSDQADGTRVSEVINLFLPNNDISLYKDNTARVVMRLEDSASGLTCTAERYVTLIDDDPCIHTGGEPICPEDDTGETL